MVYSASWCAACRDMVEYLKREYPTLDVHFIPLDRMPADVRVRALAAVRKLTWSDELPVTLLDDTVILGTDYKALVAILGPSGAPPPLGSAQHRHGTDEPAATG
jgi:thiol-disulfide isomerase/thioredoxin